MTAKLVVMIFAVFFLVLGALFVGSFVSGLFTLILTGTLPFEALDFARIGLNVLRTTYALFPQISLAMLLGILTRSTAWSLGIGIGYTLLIEGPVVRIFTMLVGGWPAEIVQWLPGALANAIMNVNQTMQLSSAIEGGIQYPAMIPAIIGVGIYTLIFFGLATIEFNNQDLPV
jgi:ABC-type transport system involved in multi-copper enzyme maturation permease subunit